MSRATIPKGILVKKITYVTEKSPVACPDGKAYLLYGVKNSTFFGGRFL